MTLWKTSLVTCDFSGSVHSRSQPALANSAVQITSMPMMSMVESSAPSRRTSCSRCWLASVGSSSTLTV